MKRQVGMIGLQAEELECVRRLVRLLRHHDPVVSELTRQALTYLEVLASQSSSLQTPAQSAALTRLHN
jgi:hypothetical protein